MNERPGQITLLDTKSKSSFLGTLSYIACLSSWVGGFFLMIATLLLFCVGLWKQSILLFIVIAAVDRAATCKIYPWVREWCQCGPHYLQHMTIVAQGKIQEDVPTMYVFHPHGIFGTGWMASYLNPAMYHVYFCFAASLYKNPFFRLLACSISNGQPADKKNFRRLLGEKKSVAIIPGGLQEATIFRYGCDRVWLRNRAGFVKYALQTGHTIRPAYVFGESETYFNVQGFLNFRLWLNDFGIPGIMPFGTWWWPLLPRKCNVHVVIGQNLHLPVIQSPTRDDISKWHNLYIKALQKLFNENKKQYGFGDRELEIWPLVQHMKEP